MPTLLLEERMKKQVKAVCTACGGTGVYSGMCEAKGTAVVCINCDGTGCEVIKYEPFVERKKRRGIKTVHQSRGRLIPTGVGPKEGSVTYKEFLSGKMPPTSSNDK